MPLFQESQEHSDFRKVFRKFVAKEITPHREEWEKAGTVPRDLWIKMGKQGFMCPWLPEEYGGLDVDARYSLLIVNEELAWGDGFHVGVPLHSDVATPYLFSYGKEELKKRVAAQDYHGRSHLRYRPYGAGRGIGSRLASNQGCKRWGPLYYQWLEDIHYQRHVR